MKNISVVTKYFYPVVGGIENSILETYSRLPKDHYNILIHTSRDTYERENTLSTKEKTKGLAVLRYDTGNFGFWPNIEFKKTDYLVLHNFNIFPHSLIIFYTSLLKIIGKKNYSLIISPHGGMTPNYSNLGKIESLIKRLVNFFLIRSLVNYSVDSIRVVSDWEKDKIKSLGVSPSIINYVQDGIEDEAFVKIESNSKTHGRIKSFGKYIVQIGKVYPTKNYEASIRSLKFLSDNINLVIIGRTKDKNYKESLVRIVHKEGLTKRVHFLESVTVKEKYQILSHASCFVLTSAWESFGRITFEALSQGLIVIVSDKSAPSYLISKKKVIGFKFGGSDPVKLAELIKKALILKSSKKYKAVQKINKSVSLEYSWNEVSNNFNKLLTNL